MEAEVVSASGDGEGRGGVATASRDINAAAPALAATVEDFLDGSCRKKRRTDAGDIPVAVARPIAQAQEGTRGGKKGTKTSGRVSHADRWERNYRKLATFREEAGHFQVPENVEFSSLCHWVGNQRHSYKSGKMTIDRATRLQRIGFAWDGRTPVARPVAKKSTLNPSSADTLKDSIPVPIAQEKSNDRTNRSKANNEKPAVDQIVLKQLALGLIRESTFSSTYSYSQNQSLKRLLEKDPALVAVMEGNNRAVPTYVTRAVEALDRLIPTLHPCASKQAAHDRGHKNMKGISNLAVGGSMALGERERAHQLELSALRATLGVEFGGVERRPLQPTAEIGRLSRRVATLEAELATRPSLPSPGEQRWDARYNEMLGFRLEHGHCRVPLSNPLSRWVRSQRRAYLRIKRGQTSLERSGGLSAERVSRLDRLGFVWNAIGEHGHAILDERGGDGGGDGGDAAEPSADIENCDQLWECRFLQLERYRVECGHCEITDREDEALRLWVSRQRAKYHDIRPDGTRALRPDHTERLAVLGVDWMTPAMGRAERFWDARFAELAAYREAMGDCRVPFLYGENPPLGKWVTAQRVSYKEFQKHGWRSRRVFNAEKIRRLEEIGFEWELVVRRWRKKPKDFEEGSAECNPQPREEQLQQPEQLQHQPQLEPTKPNSEEA